MFFTIRRNSALNASIPDFKLIDSIPLLFTFKIESYQRCSIFRLFVCLVFAGEVPGAAVWRSRRSWAVSQRTCSNVSRQFCCAGPPRRRPSNAGEVCRRCDIPGSSCAPVLTASFALLISITVSVFWATGHRLSTTFFDFVNTLVILENLLSTFEFPISMRLPPAGSRPFPSRITTNTNKNAHTRSCRRDVLLFSGARPALPRPEVHAGTCYQVSGIHNTHSPSLRTRARTLLCDNRTGLLCFNQ